MELPSIKILGRQKRLPWGRFVKLQRTAAQLARGRGQPKGVFRFSSFEAGEAWTKNLNRRPTK